MTDSKDALNEALKNFKAPTPPVASVTPRPENPLGGIEMIDKKPGLWIYPDGREVIQRDAAGGKILSSRWKIAFRESKGICCLCQQRVLFMASLEHKNSKGAGGGTHDDRQSNLGISHRRGNIAKGSMSLEQYLKLDPAVRIRNCQSA